MFFNQVPHCPPSLKLIIKVYRFAGFSFSGVGFSNLDKGDYFHPLLRSLPGTIFFLWHLVGLITVARMGTYSIYYSYSDSSNWSNESMSPIEGFLREGFKVYRAEFSDFKPILRTILDSIFIVFIFDFFINYPLNFLTGGKLIETFLCIPKIRAFDCNFSFSFKLFGVPFFFVFLSYIFGLILFDRKHLFLIGKLIVDRQSVESEQVPNIILLLLPAISYPIYLVLQSMSTILYIYGMVMIQKNILNLAMELPENLNEHQLEVLKCKLTQLNKIFLSIKSNLSLSLTWVEMGNIFIIIAAICYLIIIPDKEHYFSAIICCYLTFGLGRLLALGWAGQLPASAMESLIIQTFEKMDRNWTLDRWMAFKEIRKLHKLFQSNIWGVYTLEQSTILTALGFALGYIVVLLQTESFATDVAPK